MMEGEPILVQDENGNQVLDPSFRVNEKGETVKNRLNYVLKIFNRDGEVVYQRMFQNKPLLDQIGNVFIFSDADDMQITVVKCKKKKENDTRKKF